MGHVHLQHTESEPTHAATERVRPEELAAALSRLEERRQREAAQQAGTVPLGEMLQELGVDRSPEEVLAEIEAQRAAELLAQQAAQQSSQLRTRTRRPHLAFVIAVLVAFGLLAGVPLVFLRS